MADDALRWLRKGSFSYSHYRAQSQRSTPIQWVVDSPQFRRWLEDDRQVLLYVGKPGSGKTVATSLVVDTLLERFGSEDNIGIAFLYPSSEEQSSPGQLFESLLYQLGQRLRVLPAVLKEICSRCKAGTSLPTTNDLLRGIYAICDSLSKVYFVVDALDELPSSYRRILLSKLFELREAHSISLLATSRQSSDTLQRFDQFPILEIDAADDVAAFVAHALRSLPQFLTEDEETRANLEKAIVQKSNGSSVELFALRDFVN
jgi:Cdc6-like AAA superfamily ATPase